MKNFFLIIFSLIIFCITVFSGSVFAASSNNSAGISLEVISANDVTPTPTATPTPTPTPTTAPASSSTSTDSTTSSSSTVTPTQLPSPVIKPSLPSALKIFDIGGVDKIFISDLPVVVKIWVDEWKKAIIEEIQKTEKGQKTKGKKKCDINEDNGCDLKDFSVLMFYIER